MPIHVRIAGGGQSLRDRCAAALAAGEFQVAAEGDPRPADVVVLLAEADVSAVDSSAGVIAIAPSGAGDALLPADFTDRELQLACRLAGVLAAARRSLGKARLEEQHLRHWVETDPVTGLANRRSWEAARLLLVGQCMANGEPLVLVLIDLDRFKLVNSDVGYEAGDRVLAGVGRVLQQAVRQRDFVARFGGDEFGLLLPGLAGDLAGSVVGRIRSAVEAARLTPPVTASAGYAVIVGDRSGDAATLASAAFTAADRALRAAKLAGGNCSREGLVDSIDAGPY